MSKGPKRINTDLEGKVSGYAVWRQDWDESEAGWGIRPDGYSLHLTNEQAKAYVAAYWREEKERNPSGAVPHEYSRECGDPYKVLVDKKTYEEIKASKGGIREY